MYTNPGKKGFGDATVGHLFSRHSHSIDPYENKKNKELVRIIAFFIIKIFFFRKIKLMKKRRFYPISLIVVRDTLKHALLLINKPMKLQMKMFFFPL